MERVMKIKNPNMGLRWLTLFVILFNTAFNYLYMYLPGIKSMDEVSDKYFSLFTPAPFTFSIWGLIYLAFVIYGIAQLMPSEKSKWIYDHLAGPVIFIHLMASAWIVAYGYEYMTTSYGIILFMLIGGSVAFGRAKNSMINPAYSRWLTIPFSLFLGWISVAVIANTATYLVYQGMNVSTGEALNYTAAMVAIAFWLALIVSMVFRDWIIPMVVGWALYGIYMANYLYSHALSNLALIGAIVLGLWGFSYAVYRSTRIRQFLNEYHQLHKEPLRH